MKGKPSKIKDKTIINDIRKGGSKIPRFAEIVKAQKEMTIKRILDNKNGKWSMLALKLMGLTHHDILCKYSPVNLIYNNAGIRKVKDLFTKEGKALTISELKSTYQCNINPMAYNSIFPTISKEWKRLIDQVIKRDKVQENEIKILFRNKICPLKR